jgi:hypothetical protein
MSYTKSLVKIPTFENDLYINIMYLKCLFNTVCFNLKNPYIYDYENIHKN